MSREAIEEMVDRWMNDLEFRQAVQRDAEAAVRAAGFELDADEWSALKAIDWNMSDEELMTRSNMHGLP